MWKSSYDIHASVPKFDRYMPRELSWRVGDESIRDHSSPPRRISPVLNTERVYLGDRGRGGFVTPSKTCEDIPRYTFTQDYPPLTLTQEGKENNIKNWWDVLRRILREVWMIRLPRWCIRCKPKIVYQFLLDFDYSVMLHGHIFPTIILYRHRDRILYHCFQKKKSRCL
jgi:hypothetical protein